jgi:hypothetical protein
LADSIGGKAVSDIFRHTVAEKIRALAPIVAGHRNISITPVASIRTKPKEEFV